MVRGLLDADVPVRVVARDPARLAPGVAAQAEVVTGSHGDPDVMAAAVDGADTVFWLVPPDPAAAGVDQAFAGFARPVLDALAGRRVVAVSALGRGTPVAARAGRVTATHAMDDLIAGTAAAYRALVTSSFMDNLLRHVGPIITDGVFYGPHRPDLAMPHVATRDVAAAAVRLLRDRTWTGRAEVPVLGPEDLTFDRIAEIAGEVLGRPVRYRQVPGDAFVAAMMRAGNTEPMARSLLDMALAKNDGLDAGVARTPGTTGPTTFRQWCREVLRPAAERSAAIAGGAGGR
ncbi:NAD(P)H-binding protein [Catenuloplanes indicus JCM 9534]